jgi:dihydrofolate reductase
MRKLVLRVLDYSLDGIIAEEGSEFFQFCRDLPDDAAQLAQTRSLYQHADLHIMGRVSYQGMAQYFPTATDHPYADLMNAARKVVLSRTLTTADWANSTVARGDLAEEINRLKREGTGDIIANGGMSFWQSLIRLDLADEYRVTVFPFVAGKGRRLFDALDVSRQLEFVSSTPFANGTVELQYRRRR